MAPSSDPSTSPPSASGKKNSKLGGGCVILFGLPFLLVGLFMLYLTGKLVWDYSQVQNWDSVAVTLHSAELETNRGSDSTTYRAVATYSYTYNGAEYLGDRVGLIGGSDNLGDWHERVAAHLERKLESGETVTGYVNPENPHDAVLYRDMRWGNLAMQLVFGLVFGSIGAGVIFAGLFAGKSGKERAKLTEHHPHEPWKWRKDWASGRLEDSGKVAVWVMLAFAVFWNAISWPLALMAFADEEELGTLLLVGIFPLIGTLLALACVYLWIRQLKYGVSVFEMGAIPGVLGGRLSGMVHTRVGLRPEEGFHVTLSCIRRQQSGSGRNRSTSEHVLWQESQVIRKDALAHDPSRSAIPVLFAIPYDQPPSEPEGNLGVQWRLEVRAKVPGVDYAAQFQVPVFETAESDPEFQLDDSALRDYVMENPPHEDLRRAGVRVEDSGGEIRYNFPAARNLGLAFSLTLFTLIFGGATYAMFMGGVPWLFAGLFGVVSLILLLSSFHAWFGWAEVALRSGRLELTHGVLIFRKTETLSRQVIREIAIERGMQQGRRLFYKVRVLTSDGRTMTAGQSLPSQHLAGVLRDDLSNRLGLAVSGTG